MNEERRETMNSGHAGRYRQVQIYVGKLFRIFMNEKNWKLLIFAVVIGGILCAVMGDAFLIGKTATRVGSFALVSACIWIGIFNSIQSICKERAIIKREHRTGLHISAYVMAHMVYQFVICFAQALILLITMTIFYGKHFPARGLMTGSFILDFFIILFLVIYASAVLGLAVSALVNNTTTAMTVMPFVLIIELLFSGSIFQLSGPIARVSDLTISKWGMYAVCTESNINGMEDYTLWNQYAGLTGIPGFTPMKDRLLDLSDELIAYGDSNYGLQKLSVIRELTSSVGEMADSQEYQNVIGYAEEAKKRLKTEETLNSKLKKENIITSEQLDWFLKELDKDVNLVRSISENDKLWEALDLIGPASKFVKKISSDGEKVTDQDIRNALYELSNKLTYEEIYSYHALNIFKELGWIAAYIVLYYCIAVLRLEFIDRDRR